VKPLSSRIGCIGCGFAAANIDATRFSRGRETPFAVSGGTPIVLRRGAGRRDCTQYEQQCRAPRRQRSPSRRRLCSDWRVSFGHIFCDE